MASRIRRLNGIGRVGGVIATQIFPIATNFLDRLLLTGIALRVLGIAQFEYWSVALSIVSLLTVFDLGCMMNFSNMVVHAKERGETERSVLLYAQSNVIFLLIGLIATGVGCLVAGISGLQSFLGFHPTTDLAQTALVLVALSVAAGAKLATTNAIAAYRASLLFGRGTIITAIGDLIRILATIVGIYLSHDLIGASIGHLVGTFAGILLVQGDIWFRLADYRYRWRSPLTAEIKGAWRTSLAFAAPLLPMTAMLQVPILFLSGRSSTGEGVVAAFVLTRTMSNVLRTLIWQATNVLGMEVARMTVRGRTAIVRQFLDLLSWQMAVALGTVAGILVAAGGQFVQLWTGSDQLFDPIVLAIMLSPFVLAPTYLLGTALLNYSNTPKVWSIGSYAQVVAAVIIYVLLANTPVLPRVACSVYGGELIAMAFPVAVAARGPLGLRGLAQELSRTAVSVLAAVIAYALTSLITSLGTAGSWPTLFIAGAVAALPCASIVLYLTWRIAAVDRSQP